jgi:hypothetical protein
VTISSDAFYTFSVTVVDHSTSEVKVSVADIEDAQDNFSGGYVGFVSFSGSGNDPLMYLDDFSLEVTEWSVVVSDDFNRTDTAYSTNGAAIGTDWVNAGATQWKVESNQLQLLSPSAQKSILYNTGVETLSGGGGSFSLEGFVKSTQDGSWVGMVFNYQDVGNFYALRFQPNSPTWQLVRVVGGGLSAFSSGTSTTNFIKNRGYDLKITSDDLYTFSAQIMDHSTSEIMMSVSDVTDPNSNFTGGCAGFFSLSGSGNDPLLYADNFSLKVMSAASSYELWASGWGGDIGSLTNDFDGDFIDNLGEYAVGGNPTNALDTGAASTLLFNGTDLCYVHAQRSDDSSLLYTLQATDDLVHGVWTNPVCAVISTNVTGETIDFVTNTILNIGQQYFIKLVVQQD